MCLTDAQVAEIFNAAGVSGTYVPDLEAPEPALVEVSLDACGGSFDGDNPVYVTLGGPYGSLPAPCWEGYTFMGWFSYDLSDWVTSETTVSLGSSHTFYAQWYPGGP